jgi:hypothetical protein
MLREKFLYHNTVRSAPFLTTLCTSKQATWRRKGKHGAYAIGKGTMEEISRNKGRFVIRPARYQPKGLTGITTGGMFQ